MAKNQIDFKQIEDKWRKFWEKKKIYKFDTNSRKQIYSIDTPPPYASAGHLHVGHALSYTQFEIVARIMRMSGFNVYFAPCFDDNGLPTEKYVEEKYKINKAKTNRADFRKLCIKESEKVEKNYAENVFKKMGHSYDWDLIYTTISPEAQRVAQNSFLKLIEKGECYRGKEPTIWCPYHETALAQAEVEDLERKSKLNYIEFDIEDSKEKVLIATTRPEFLPACVGIFVNPKNKKLIGKKIKIPLFDYSVKVYADESVDSEFGTGIMMVCTFGDTADIEKWKKYKLDLRICIDEKGLLNKNAGKFAGLDLKIAREKILDDLKKEGRLKKQEELDQTVGSCWRCSTPVEYIVKDQWFIRTLKHKKKLLEMGSKVKWHPEFMKVRYNDWVKNLGWDWSISRQRYYGVPIPAWYCEKCGKIILPSEKELPLDPLEVKKKCSCGGKGIAETDVFDTWMTSSNTPEIASRWLENPKQYKKLAPMSLRPQSHDIIRTWSFYTILKSYLLFDRIPWKDLIINTFVLDSKGKGMSKSKGNAIWADELIEKYGVDSFRYWVAGANLGNDLAFHEHELIAGKKLINKLLNASKFVFMNLKDFDGKKPKKLEFVDQAFLDRILELSNNVKKYYLEYNISRGKLETEKFFWQMFCDNYLEIVKKRVYQGEGEKKKSAQYVLYQSLFVVLKLFSPIMPFITEEIYQEHFKKFEKVESIHLMEFPEVGVWNLSEAKFDVEFQSLLETIAKIRQEKTKAGKAMNAECVLTLERAEFVWAENLFGEDLKDVMNVQEIKEGKKFGVAF